MTELQAFLLFLQAKIMPPSDPGSIVQILLRWIHLLAGITWIGLLYFFNLVNVGIYATVRRRGDYSSLTASLQ